MLHGAWVVVLLKRRQTTPQEQVFPSSLTYLFFGLTRTLFSQLAKLTIGSKHQAQFCTSSELLDPFTVLCQNLFAAMANNPLPVGSQLPWYNNDEFIAARQKMIPPYGRTTYSETSPVKVLLEGMLTSSKSSRVLWGPHRQM